jgi:hypothetical protein
MKLKTSGLGLIALGILLLGAQLVLYSGFKNIYPPPGSGETHIEPPPQARLTPLPGVFGALSLIAGIALVAKRKAEVDDDDKADDPSDGLSIPAQGAEKTRQQHR